MPDGWRKLESTAWWHSLPIVHSRPRRKADASMMGSNVVPSISIAVECLADLPQVEYFLANFSILSGHNAPLAYILSSKVKNRRAETGTGLGVKRGVKWWGRECHIGCGIYPN